MVIKNYITREEQNVWEYISEKGIVDNEAIKNIFPEMKGAKRNRLLHELYKKGCLKRARKDLYYNPQKLDSFYELALKMHEGYIGLNSALRFHNLIGYEDFTIFVITKSFRKQVHLNGTQYDIQFIPLKGNFSGFEKKENLYYSSIEKTLFDCFLKPAYVGFANITHALYDAKLDWNKFISFYMPTKNHALCQRTGYLLELVKRKTGKRIPHFVFAFLKKRVKNPVKLSNEKGKTSYSRKWKIQDNVGERKIISWWN